MGMPSAQRAALACRAQLRVCVWMAGEIDFDEFCMTMSMCIGGGQLTDEEFVDMIFQSARDYLLQRLAPTRLALPLPATAALPSLSSASPHWSDRG